MVKGAHTPIPFSPPLEDAFIPTADRIGRRCAGEAGEGFFKSIA